MRVLRPGGGLIVVEADRGCHLADARSFVARARLPRPLRPVALAAFRTWVAGQGLDLDEARALLSALPVRDATVERVAGAPALMMQARAA